MTELKKLFENIDDTEKITMEYATLQVENISAFNELKKYVSSDEILNLIEAASNPGFKIILWNHEKRFDKMEEVFTEELKCSSFYDSPISL